MAHVALPLGAARHAHHPWSPRGGIASRSSSVASEPQKKEKDSGHTDEPSSSKGHNKKRKADHSVNMVDRP
jgi:hypothetical protein